MSDSTPPPIGPGELGGAAKERRYRGYLQLDEAAYQDASEAEVPSGFDVQGFPTIMFVPAKEGATPIPYEDARDLDSMAEFVKANAAVSIKDEL